MLKILIALVLCACVRQPHVDPAPRSEVDASRSVVLVESSCGADDEASWGSEHRGTGVIISERYVLTAAHVTACPEIPVVHVTFRGVRWSMHVEREDIRADVARLEIATAERFHLDVPPPELAPIETETVFAHVLGRWGESSRGSTSETSTLVRHMITIHGDSGAPVYNTAGQLVGLVTAGNGIDTTIAPVGMTWLEGT